jgi:hypothetical protein
VGAVAEQERREQQVVDRRARRAHRRHADRSELHAVRELPLAAQLVAAEVLDLHLAAGALAHELHELALALGVRAFRLHGAHSKAQGLLLGGQRRLRPRAQPAGLPRARMRERRVRRKRCA